MSSLYDISYETNYQSPIGTIHLVANENSLISLSFDNKALNKNLYENEILKETCKQLDEYFSGKRKSFEISLYLYGTIFQKAVWKQLQSIPYGDYLSYLELASKLGDVNKVRAAATANSKNKILIIIPCHRVIGTDGSLVGYAGELWRKQFLLDLEMKTTQMRLF